MTKQVETISRKNKREMSTVTVTVIVYGHQASRTKNLIKSSTSIWVQLGAQVGPALLSECLPT
jgi:hypothetical protein